METPALNVLKRLQEYGFEAYFVGGCVRDMLLHRPIKDFDIATSAKTEQIIQLFPKTIPVGIQFGVVRVFFQGMEIEVATFREDGQYLDGRHPISVQFSHAKADVLRRDFTINGLLYNPFQQELIDYVNGQNDLQQKIIRTIGDPEKRFSEDKLRLLRAIRFACQLQFEIEPQTWTTLRQMAPHIIQVSRERIMEELSKIFSNKPPLRGIQLLRKSGLLFVILATNCPSSEALEASEKMIENLSTPSLENVLACLLYSFNNEEINSPSLKNSALQKKHLFQILNHLKFKHEICYQIAFLVYIQPILEQLSTKNLATFKRLAREPFFLNSLEIYRARLIEQGTPLDSYEWLFQRFHRYKQILNDPLYLKGQDLIQLGFTPGPEFHKILFALEEEQLNETIHNRTEAIEWLSKRCYSK
ncbi:MAG: CCA tRNA nucleotidyltransferase [Planctomycetota bacterium]